MFLLTAIVVDHAVSFRSWEYYLEKGTIEFNEQMYDFALENLARSLSLNERLNDAANMIGEIYARRFKYDKAIRYYKRSLEINPAQDAIHIRLGDIYHLLGKFDLALEQYRQAVTHNPNNLTGHFHLVVQYHAVNDRLNAGKHFSACEAIGRARGLALLAEGRAAEANKKRAAANELYAKAIEACPVLVDAYFASADLLRRENKIIEAAKLIDRIIAISPDNERAYVYLAHLLFDARTNRFRSTHLRKILDCLNRAISLNPKNVESHLMIAGVYRFSQKAELAEEHERRARELEDPR